MKKSTKKKPITNLKEYQKLCKKTAKKFETDEKLKKRYSKGFTTKAAKRKGTRIDWNEK